MSTSIVTDILVIGSGLAGISFCLKFNVSPEINIILISKENLQETNTSYAQGGIAAVLSPKDSFDEHIRDTLIAGDGLCRQDIVEFIIKNGPNAIEDLINWGINFDEDQDSKLALGLEAGHLKRRVVHVKDATGFAIQNAIVEKVRKQKNVTIYENYIAIDLAIINGRVVGAYVLDKNENQIINISAKATILATGGTGKVFRYTSNPDIASGDGLAMGFRAGTIIANMEFIQFHPTLYYNTEFKTFLISEALRGEGGRLRSVQGEYFVENVHHLKELAPRDIVARAIDAELKKSGEDYVLLDMTHLDPEFLKNRFPKIYSTLLEKGLDMTLEPIPVVPASHYTIGGIKTDINGKTSVESLYAIGEVANTGLHGANRLASNSLLEAMVMADQCANHLKTSDELENGRFLTFPQWETGDAVDSDEAVIINNNWAELRRFMWNYVGIVRTDKRLLRAKERIKLLKREILEYYWKYTVTPDILELRNLVEVAHLIVNSALARKESRGTHFTSDYPHHQEEIRETLIQKNLGVFFSEVIKTEKID
jgi:L-aspartate oxidase